MKETVRGSRGEIIRLHISIDNGVQSMLLLQHQGQRRYDRHLDVGECFLPSLRLWS